MEAIKCFIDLSVNNDKKDKMDYFVEYWEEMFLDRLKEDKAEVIRRYLAE